MTFLSKLGGRLPDFGDVVRRFPVAVALMAVFALWLISQNFGSRYGDNEVAGGFILAGYLAVIVQLMSESRGWSVLASIVIKLLAATGAMALCVCYKPLNFAIPFAVLAVILFLGNARLWRRERDDQQVWNFTQKFWTGAIFAIVGSVIFALGVIAIQAAVDTLFGAKINRLTEDIILPIGLAFLAPVYWLGTVPGPQTNTDVEALSFEARALSFLGTWMLAPLLSVYALIILAYAVKIIVQWDVPKGEIAWLVTPFIGVGTLVWLMLEPKVLNENAFVRFYRRSWHWVMIPAAALLGLAVILRVRAYGFTVERVFLMGVFVWAVLQALWFAVLPIARRDIRIPTAMAAGGLVFCAFLAQPLSVWSQYGRAADAKEKLGTFSAEVVDANPEAAKAYLGAMKYLVKKDHHDEAERIDASIPDSTYGDKWSLYLRRLNLVNIAEPRNRIQTLTVVASAIDIQSNVTLYGPTSLYVHTDQSHKNKPDGEDGFLSFQAYTATWTDGSERFVFDLQPMIEATQKPAETEVKVEREFPPLAVVGDQGRTATMYLRSGRLRWEGDQDRKGNFTVLIAVTD